MGGIAAVMRPYPAVVSSGSYRPILLKKSRRDFCPGKSVSDVEIWCVKKTEPPCFLRSNTEIEHFLSYQETFLSETDFFNRIGQ